MNDQPMLPMFGDGEPAPADVDAAYYNTNQETGETLAASELNAQQQQWIVLAFFQNNPQTCFAPHEVHAAVTDDGRTPLTSIRRAITNLTASGRLEKTPEMRPGTFGKQVHTWKLAAHNTIGALA